MKQITKQITKKVIVLVLIAIFTSVAFAGQKNLYQGDSFTGVPDFLSATGPARYKDGTPCADNCLLQGVVEIYSPIALPPVTNSARFYVDYPSNSVSTFDIGTLAGDWTATPHPHRNRGCGSVGGLNGLGGTGVPALGNYKMGVGGNNNNLGWLRLYSFTHPTNSVYFGDGIQHSLPGSADYAHAGDIICSNINPAYSVLFIEQPNNTNDTAHIQCTVANVGNGNNQIPASVIHLVYKLTNETVWTEGGTGTNVFDVVPAEAGDYHVKVWLDSVRPELPVSSIYMVTGVIPEPGFIGLVLITIFAFFWRK